MPASEGLTSGSDPHIGQAPGDLATVRDFVNTLDIEKGTDALATPADLDSWLRVAGLAVGPDDPSGPRDLALAVELREALRGVLRSHITHKAARSLAAAADPRATVAGAAVARAAVASTAAAGPAARVGDIAAALRAGIRAEPDGRIVVVPAGSGARGALTRLLLIAAESATASTWARLKVCSADDCQWAFYDRSPTRSGCWCSMQICGSRAKSRAYRSRAARTS
jgi:predicted RNA-binding Zn ribbon-like protein